MRPQESSLFPSVCEYLFPELWLYSKSCGKCFEMCCKSEACPLVVLRVLAGFRQWCCAVQRPLTVQRGSPSTLRWVGKPIRRLLKYRAKISEFKFQVCFRWHNRLRWVTVLFWVLGVSSLRWPRGWSYRAGHLLWDASPLVWHPFSYTAWPRERYVTPWRICFQGDRDADMFLPSPNPVQLLSELTTGGKGIMELIARPPWAMIFVSRQSYSTFIANIRGSCSI